jgi:hypothetical protein
MEEGISDLGVMVKRPNISHVNSPINSPNSRYEVEDIHIMNCSEEHEKIVMSNSSMQGY